MKATLMEKLCCPFDKNDLKLQVYQKDDHGNILEGLLTCVYCQRYYPIVHGIPIMSPDEYREEGLEKPLLEKWGLQLSASEEARFRLGQKSEV